MKFKKKHLFELFLIVILFIVISFIVQSDFSKLTSYMKNSPIGIITFILLVALSIVVAPISVIPLFPIATKIWGIFLSAIFGIIGWTMGAIIAFILARKYGCMLVSKIIPLEQIHKFEKKIPKTNIFWTVVFLRMITPVDGLSYLLGLFSTMSLKNYTFATIIGLIPFTFILAYAGTISPVYQLVLAVIAVLSVLIVVFINKKKSS